MHRNLCIVEEQKESVGHCGKYWSGIGMKEEHKIGKIQRDETMRETAEHGSAEYPFQYYLENFWEFDLHCIDWHWHSEVEFVYMDRGNARCLVGDKQFILHEGEGLFINSQVLHRFEVTENVLAPNIVFSAGMLATEDSLLYKKYILPILCSEIAYLIFSPQIYWQEEVVECLKGIFELQKRNLQEKKIENQVNGPGAEFSENFARSRKDYPVELQTVQKLLKLWELIYCNVDTEALKKTGKQNTSAGKQAQLQIMMQYIHENYRRTITLEEIAGTVNLSKSSALHVFQTYLRTSPVRYLISYRLKCATRLLRMTENSIQTIALESGFESSGYFCRKFRELYGITPGEYRKNEKNYDNIWINNG